MINLKNFDRKKLFKSKSIIMGAVFLLTIIISGVLYMGIKSTASQKAEKKSQAEGDVVHIKTTKEVEDCGTHRRYTSKKLGLVCIHRRYTSKTCL